MNIVFFVLAVDSHKVQHNVHLVNNRIPLTELICRIAITPIR